MQDLIKKLDGYQSRDFMLSVYLSLDGKDTPNNQQMESIFHSLVHESLNDNLQKAYAKDLKRIEEYLRQTYNSRGTRTLVVFSDDKNLWETLELEFVVLPILMLSKKPFLDPLKSVLTQYQKYLVVLLDREKAKVFTVNLGKIEEGKKFLDMMVPQKVKAETVYYGRDDKIFRHIEDHLDEHLKQVAKATVDFAKQQDIRFIILGGNPLLFDKFKKELRCPFNELVLGEFVADLDLPLNKSLQKSKQIARQINKKLFPS